MSKPSIISQHDLQWEEISLYSVIVDKINLDSMSVV